MNSAPDHPLPETMVARIIAVAYGEASPAARLRVQLAARRNPAVRRLLREHRRIAQTVRHISVPRAPAAIAARVRAEIDGSDPRTAIPRTRYHLLWAGAAIAAASALLLLPQSPPHPADIAAPQYSQAEIEEARLQIQAAFAIVSHGMQKAGTTLHHEILAPTVARPIRDGTAVLHDLFGKEN